MKKILLFCILYLPIEPLFGQAFNDLFVGNFKFLNLLPNIKDKENSIDSVSNELSGEVKTTMLIIIKSTPTKRGTYQCLIEFLIECKNDDFILFFFKC